MSRPLPGPQGGLFYLPLWSLRRDPLGFFDGLHRRYGPRVHFRLGAGHVFVFNDPEGAQAILVENPRAFEKGVVLRRARAVLGEGLLTSEGAHHLRQRRLLQPVFHRERIARYAGEMATQAEALARGFEPGAQVDLTARLMEHTLTVLGRCLFGTDLSTAAPAVAGAVSDVLGYFDRLTLPFAAALLQSPLPGAVRFRRGTRTLRALIDALIAQRRAGAAPDREDLLSLLLSAQDEDGRPMSPEQVRDEVLTLIAAGHETTALAVTWAVYLVAGAPEEEARIRAEVERVARGRDLGGQDFEGLPYTRQVLAEALRLYPPAWILGRRTVAELEVRGTLVPEGSVVIVSPWVIHRDPAWHPHPDRFDPDRFAPGQRDGQPRFSYFPFGGGIRQCIGEHFAWMEGTLTLAALVRRWRWRRVSEEAPELRPLITLRPRDPLMLVPLSPDSAAPP